MKLKLHSTPCYGDTTKWRQNPGNGSKVEMVKTDCLLILGIFILEEIPSHIPGFMVLIVEMILHCAPLAVILGMDLFVLVLHMALVPFVRTWMANHCVFVRRVSLGMNLSASIHLTQDTPWLLLTKQKINVFQNDHSCFSNWRVNKTERTASCHIIIRAVIALLIGFEAKPFIATITISSLNGVGESFHPVPYQPL